MRRHLLAAALLVATSGSARAQAQQQPPAPHHHWNLELGANGYLPDIDSEFSTSPGPFEQTFGTGRGWMFRFGFSRALWTKFGSLEAGLRSGYFRASGKGMSELPPAAGSTTPTFQPSAQTQSFNIVPSSVIVTYRFDWVAQRYPVPLAPYVRVAFERYNWWIATGTHTRYGATNGWSATAGLALLLDWFDRQAARDLARETGIKGTYAFVDITQSSVDDFGSSKSWNLSDTRPSLGFGMFFVF